MFFIVYSDLQSDRTWRETCYGLPKGHKHCQFASKFEFQSNSVPYSVPPALLQCIYVTSTQDSQISAIATGSLLGDSFFSNTNENLSIVSGYSGFLQSMKGAADLQPSSLFDHHANSADGDVSWLKADRFGGRPDEGSFQFLHKRSRNIGSKSRRLLMDNEEALELKLSWEEAQELLRPAPSAKPTVVMIEDYEFEEYDVSWLRSSRSSTSRHPSLEA